MRKINLLLVLAVLMMLTGTAWAGVTADELMSVVDDKGGLLTRGEYARMLVVAAGMEENGYPEQTLVTKGILKGYPDDGLQPVGGSQLGGKGIGLDRCYCTSGRCRCSFGQEPLGIQSLRVVYKARIGGR